MMTRVMAILSIAFSSLIPLTCSVLFAQSTAAPTLLPGAARQTPNWPAYNALGIRSAGVNAFYLDPVTYVRVTKITSESFPQVNLSMGHDYSEGGPYISMEWGSAQHTIVVRTNDGFSWLMDYQRGVGVNNPRQFPAGGPRPDGDLGVAFSSVSPQFLFFVHTNPTTKNASLYKFNTWTNQLVGDASIPASGQLIQSGGAGIQWNQLGWLQISKDDKWLVMQGCVIKTGDPFEICVTRYVYAFDRVNDRLHVKTCDAGANKVWKCQDLWKWNPVLLRSEECPPDTFCDGFLDTSDLDEPHMDRNGTYVTLLDGGGHDCGPGQPETQTFGSRWHRWQLNDVVALDSIACKQNLYAGHVAWVRGYYANVNGDINESPNYYYSPASNPANDIAINTANYSAANAFLADHQAGQWIQPIGDLNQWVWGSNTQTDGVVKPHVWVREGSSQIYHTAPPADCEAVPAGEVCWDYQKWSLAQQGGIVAYQADTSDSNHMAKKLTRVTSLPLAIEGTFYYNPANPLPLNAHELTVWAFGGGDPLNRVYFSTPTPVHWGVGVRRINGSDIRLLCHNYSWSADIYADGSPDYDRNYTTNPFATTSPDGKLVMFRSNMGYRHDVDENPGSVLERSDVFVAEVPVTGSGGGGGGGCGGAMGEGMLGPPHCE